ncbi:hypothetical protein GLOIN_2v1773495 [Rhizophagus clarus]|uniref:Uncharacterized protein n=1 Tax=Rhizophagus clarus TaxID=94130 RepID=A0A8H3LRC3_9GLOM|nr:hypothetical protein GLOIN_2v1773495 [Rhizophagus clarus]
MDQSNRLIEWIIKRNIVKMNLNCFVLDTGILFPIPLGEKVSVEKYVLHRIVIYQYLQGVFLERKNNILKGLTNDVSKLDLWRVNVAEVVNISDDIVRKLRGDKMKANFLLSDYFSVSDPPPQRNIHIIIHRPPLIKDSVNWTIGLNNFISPVKVNFIGFISIAIIDLPRQNCRGGTSLIKKEQGAYTVEDLSRGG